MAELTSPFPPSGCGSPTDKDSLWDGVKDATHDKPRPNDKVMDPVDNKAGYAIRNGNDGTIDGPYNMLFIPKARITGVECPKILDDRNYINFWHYAWQEAQLLWPKKDVMLGINSFHGRSHAQLHIHLTYFFDKARAVLDKTRIADVSNWNSTHSMVELPTNPNPKHPSTAPYAYRVAHAKSLDDNVFGLVNKYVVNGGNDMFQQAIAVVGAPATVGGGYYLIATEGRPDGTQEIRKSPDLHVNNSRGTQTVEGLMYRG